MASTKYNAIELTWIKDVLDQHGEYLVDLIQETIREKNLIKSGELQESISYKTSMDGNNPKLSLSFISYGRAIEINYHKKSRNTQSMLKPNTNAIVWGSMRKNAKTKKKKDTNFYARNAYGSLNRLIGILMYEFSDYERARIKGILEYQATTGTA